MKSSLPRIEVSLSQIRENTKKLSELYMQKGISLMGVTKAVRGNSANYEWFKSSQDVGRVNNLRLGESILLGCETVGRKAIPGLHTGAFQLIAEVIESKRKASVPLGEICQDAFGNVPGFLDRGERQRVIIALGRQDVQVSNLKSNSKLKIIGSSSDHIILDGENHKLKVGDNIRFSLDYGGLLATMTSPFVIKQFTDSKAHVAA